MELPAIVHPEVAEFIGQNTSKLFELTGAFGSPLHLVFPSIVGDNIESFRRAFSEQGTAGEILYASKANKSESILEAVAGKDAGVDASSLYELRQALNHGVQGPRIGISGPTKDVRLIVLALQQNCTITVDSIGDLNQVIQIQEALNAPHKAQLLIRLNDFGKKQSRFGISRSELTIAYQLLQDKTEYVDLLGFAFHLEGYSIEERAQAIATLIPEMENARRIDFNCDTLDMGGGFTISYLDQETWQKFLEASRSTDSLFFNGKKFDSFYPYFNQFPKDAFLARILSNRTQTNGSIAEVLNRAGIKLVIEPGRALLDQAGITLMTVKDVKTTATGEQVVVMEANYTHLSEQLFNTDFIPDPILVQRSTTEETSPFVASVAGNTCMEIDMITWRKIGFKSKPRRGDLLAYINTAGYQMDTNESEFHGLPIPEKQSVYKNKNEWKWKRDSQFSLLDITQ